MYWTEKGVHTKYHWKFSTLSFPPAWITQTVADNMQKQLWDSGCDPAGHSEECFLGNRRKCSCVCFPRVPPRVPGKLGVPQGVLPRVPFLTGHSRGHSPGHFLGITKKHTREHFRRFPKKHSCEWPAGSQDSGFLPWLAATVSDVRKTLGFHRTKAMM